MLFYIYLFVICYISFFFFEVIYYHTEELLSHGIKCYFLFGTGFYAVFVVFLMPHFNVDLCVLYPCI